ncbi:MAG: MMPL family transporter [Gammaproteobacteria bacterium]|nr:MMPL family transporter [Gammaproteobacteria bacterium]
MPDSGFVQDLQRHLQDWLRGTVNQAGPVLLLAVLLTAAAGHYAATHFGVNADTSALLDQSLPFMQAEREISARFPVFNDNLLLVLESHNRSRLQVQAERLFARLQQQPELFPEVSWPAGDSWLQQHGLLYQDSAALQQLADRLSAAQPMLAQLRQQTSASSLFEMLQLARQHQLSTAAGANDSATLQPILDALAVQLQRLASDSAAEPLDWRALLSGNLANPAQPGERQRELLLVRPALDTSRVMSATAALQQLQQLRDELGLSPQTAGGAEVSMQITGSVALKHEELLSSMRGAATAGLLALLMVTALLWLALRSLWMLAAALLTLMTGLVLTAAFAVWAVGDINLITIAFVVLYIGLGINYSIHFILRYQEQLSVNSRPGVPAGVPARVTARDGHNNPDHASEDEARAVAIVAAGRLLLPALALSALTTMIGFFAFIPTSYRGVAELGLIAGVSIAITLLTHYTLLPALLRLLPQPPARRLRPASRGNWLELPQRQRRPLLWVTACLAVTAALIAPQIRFDSDPLNLRQQDAESVRAMRSLLSDGRGDFRALMSSAADADQARTVRAKLLQLDSVARVLTADSLIPAQQEEKLWQLDDLRFLLGNDILSHDWQLQAAEPAQLFASMQALLAVLRQAPAAQPGQTPDNPSWQQLAEAIEALLARRSSSHDEALATAINQQLLGDLPALLRRLQDMLQPTAVIGIDQLPPQLRRAWIAADGSWLLRIYPRADGNELQQLESFVAEVNTVTDQVAGAAVKQIASGRAISRSFYQALLTALLVISLLLLLLLRSVAMTLRILLPLLLGGALTLAAMVLLALPLNYANIIALPLLLGVAVDNGIHLVWRHRLGDLPRDNVLRTATARAIVFAALTSVVSFGNLGFSSHAGSASMGILLAAGLLITLLCTLLVLPALLPAASINHNGDQNADQRP